MHICVAWCTHTCSHHHTSKPSRLHTITPSDLQVFTCAIEAFSSKQHDFIFPCKAAAELVTRSQKWEGSAPSTIGRRAPLTCLLTYLLISVGFLLHSPASSEGHADHTLTASWATDVGVGLLPMRDAGGPPSHYLHIYKTSRLHTFTSMRDAGGPALAALVGGRPRRLWVNV